MQASHRKIKLSPLRALTPEELRQRDAAIDRILEIRAEMEPVCADIAEWIREDRDEVEDELNG